MKSISLLLHGAALLTCATAKDAYLWTIDSHMVKFATTQSASISSEAASAILASRRGMSNERYLGTEEPGILSDLNYWGGHQMPLFGAAKDKTPAKFLVRISGYGGAISEFPSLPDLWVEDPHYDLLDDFKARKQVKDVCEYDLSVPTKEGVDIVYSYLPDESGCLSAREVRNLPSVLTVFSSVPTAASFSKEQGRFLKMLSHLSVTGNVQSTILVLPSPTSLKKTRTTPRSFEEPLDLPTAGSAQATQPSAIVFANSSHPLPSIIPVCFASQEACTNVTNACSGHGSCVKAHAGCFSCKCSATIVRGNASGKKTIQWGGNACHKKDVSVPFVLFASIGVFMTALIAGGIGMLYSMGAKELPSVLGAGVAGPRAQK